MKCLKCYKALKEYGKFHPVGGLHFVTYGHYGTTVFDPMDGSTLNIFVCDSCITEAYEEGIVIRRKAKE